MPINMLGAAFQRYNTRGATYIADVGGGIASVANNDVGDMLESGCTIAQGSRVLGRLIGANMNVTTDQPIFLNVPAGARWRLIEIWCGNASISLSTAVGGFYTAASKGGTVLILASQAYSGFTASTVYGAL